MIRVFLADDHQLFAEGLAQALEALPDVKVVGTAISGADLAQQAESADAQVLLVDLEMPGVPGIEAIADLPDQRRAIVVTMHAGREQRKAAARAGARGFFSKATPLSDLAAAVRAVAAGESLIALSTQELSATLERHRQAPLDPGAAALTDREKEILQLLAVGVSSTEDLADRLWISPKTVKNHLANIFGKLSVSDRTQAVIEAIRLGIVKAK